MCHLTESKISVIGNINVIGRSAWQKKSRFDPTPWTSFFYGSIIFIFLLINALTSMA